MSSLSETARRCMQLCDNNEARFRKTAAGSVDPRQVQADIAMLALRGFKIGKKTPAEVRKDCAAVDVKLVARDGPKRKGKYKANRPTFTDKQRRAKLKKVHDRMATGMFAQAACKDADVSYQSFIYWRKRFGITEPKLTGRSTKGANANQ